uniref:Uncharacterized protein LOC114344527 n=1 Tax=Diabrotica virgifera virgifera TaxID=50390 RepID=A0A6P7H593_DIAVI
MLPKRRTTYPFFSGDRGLKFFQTKKKERWFCNRPLSPFPEERKITDDDIGKIKDMNRSPDSPTYDSDIDPEYFPESDSSEDEIKEYYNHEDEFLEITENIPQNSKYLEIKDSNQTHIKKNIPKILQNLIIMPQNFITESTERPQMLTEQTSSSPGENISTEVYNNNETINFKTEKYKRKKDICYYCETDVNNFVRHLQRNHSCELEVQRILSKEKKSKERRELVSLLKKKGNFIKNSQECVKPVKQGLQPSQSFLPCSNCLGFYRSKFLYRHRKICLGGQSSRHSQAEGQNFLLKNVKKIDQRLKDEVFPRMRPDKISLEAKNDFLICAFGARYLKIHREKHHITVTSRKMRELSRILIEFKKIKACTSNLFEALKPKFYDDLVDATKLVSKYDTEKDLFFSPTYALNIGTSLKQCCDIALHMISKMEPTIETANCESNLKTLINLFQSNWRFDISNRAGNDLNLKKFNKITIVALASDLKYSSNI